MYYLPAILLVVMSAVLGVILYLRSRELTAEREARHKAESDLALARQEAVHLREKLGEAKEAAHRDMLSQSAQMFEEKSAKVSRDMLSHVDKLRENMQQLQGRMSQSSTRVEGLWQALSNPVSVGQFSEIGLENTLKNHGLAPQRDYILQHTMKDGGGHLRPDAVIFLPQDHIMVIDSKASTHMLNWMEARGSDAEGEAIERVAQRMTQHLRDLQRKDYAQAAQDYYRAARGSEARVAQVFMVMFLSSEMMIETLLQERPDFRDQAERAGVILAGPVGLAGLLSIAKYGINVAAKQENEGRIIEEISSLLGSIKPMMEHAQAVGRSVASAAKSYERFTGSVNRNVLPKARRVVSLGVEAGKGKELPAQLPSYHVINEASVTIEQNANEDAPQNTEKKRINGDKLS